MRGQITQYLTFEFDKDSSVFCICDFVCVVVGFFFVCLVFLFIYLFVHLFSDVFVFNTWSLTSLTMSSY